MNFEHGIRTLDMKMHSSCMALLQPCEAMARKINGELKFYLKPAKLKGVNCGQIQQTIITSMTNSYVGDPYGIKPVEPVTLGNEPIYAVFGRMTDINVTEEQGATGRKWYLNFTRLLGSSQRNSLQSFMMRCD